MPKRGPKRFQLTKSSTAANTIGVLLNRPAGCSCSGSELANRSKRRPGVMVSRLLIRHVSLAKNEYVIKVPSMAPASSNSTSEGTPLRRYDTDRLPYDVGRYSSKNVS